MEKKDNLILLLWSSFQLPTNPQASRLKTTWYVSICYRLNYVPLKKTWWNPNVLCASKCDLMWIFTEIIKWMWWGHRFGPWWKLTYPYVKRKFGHKDRHIYRGRCLKEVRRRRQPLTRPEMAGLTNNRSLPRTLRVAWLCWYLDFKALAFGIVRWYISVIL